MEACWAHNPEVRRSKLRSAKYNFFFLFYYATVGQHSVRKVQFSSNCVPLAQRIARWTSNPKVLGSIPRWDDSKTLLIFGPTDFYLAKAYFCNMSEWPSGLRRQTQGSKPCFPVGSEYEISGPLMRAGVRIPFLTNTFFNLIFRVQVKVPCLSISPLPISGDIAQW